ncbi:hypothetical protein H1R20_g15389, partial [Candolleomyces eurysporus]
MVEGFINPKKLRRLEINARITWKDDVLPTFWYHTLAQAANLESAKVLDYGCDSLSSSFNFSGTVSSFPVSNLTLTKLAPDQRAGS